MHLSGRSSSTLPYQHNTWENLKSREFPFQNKFPVSSPSCMLLTFCASTRVARRCVSTLAIFSLVVWTLDTLGLSQSRVWAVV